MKKGSASLLLAIIAGAFLGLIFGCLFTWFPIRLGFCAVYNTPDCEEIVLMAFPFYCLIAPLAGGIIAFWLYRRKVRSETTHNEMKDASPSNAQVQQTSEDAEGEYD